MAIEKSAGCCSPLSYIPERSLTDRNASACFGQQGLLGHCRTSEPRRSGGPHGRNRNGLRGGGSAEYEANEQNQPTLLDLGKPHPNAIFTAVIYGENRAKFATPEISLRGKRICVTGQISDYQGKPEIVLTEPSQLIQ